jgi:hypothetical protein
MEVERRGWYPPVGVANILINTWDLGDRIRLDRINIDLGGIRVPCHVVVSL